MAMKRLHDKTLQQWRNAAKQMHLLRCCLVSSHTNWQNLQEHSITHPELELFP